MEIRWTLQQFSELRNSDLYELLKLRSAIFVVEQNCVFPDMDDKDYSSYHLCGWNYDKLVAYTRLLAPGLAYENCSIGRVVTAASVRRQGVGRILMKKSIESCQQLFSSRDIEIGAQLYLEQFYSSFQFKREGEVYLEDGIDHIHMRRPLH